MPILDRMGELHIPGVSLAVVEHGEVVEQAAYGTKTAGEDAPVLESTRFQACSISKPVTSLGMLRLVEQGRLDLDADVNDTLRAWRIPANGGWQPRITLRHLASHSAGLTAHGFPGYRRGVTLPTLPQVLAGVIPANTEGVRVDIVPGVQFRYSGGGTTVMQLLLEEVTGRPIADLLRELVLDPLGMTNSGYEQPLPEALHPQAATAHDADGRPVPGGWHVYPEQSAAGLWTTPGDLCRFAIGVQRAAAGADDAIVSRETAAAMLSPQSPPSARAERIGGLNAVGIGPFVKSVDGRTSYFGHSGGNEGFRCHLLAHRDDGYAACVMTNSDAGSPLVIEAFDAIAASGGWSGYATEPLDALPPRGHALDPFLGRFTSEGGLQVKVTRSGSRLDVTFDGQPTAPFIALDATTIASQVLDTTITLDDGNLVVKQSSVETTLKRDDVA
jgi:CubicO group peptidase (beta-lactamase class C family)